MNPTAAGAAQEGVNLPGSMVEKSQADDKHKHETGTSRPQNRKKMQEKKRVEDVRAIDAWGA